MGRFVSPNLAGLPALPLDPLDFEAVYRARTGELAERLAAKGILWTASPVDSDPLSIVEQAGAWREIAAAARRDDAIRAVLLATSWGSFLDHIGATQTPAVIRKALVAEPRPYVYLTASVDDWESDDDLRARIALAPESLSPFGPEGAYLYYALSTPGVKSAAVYGPQSFGGTALDPFAPLGCVRVPIVGAADDGAPSAGLVAACQAELRAPDRRPIADFVEVVAAEIVPYTVRAVLYVGPGADAGYLRKTAIDRLAAQAQRQHRPGAAATRRGLYGAAFVPEVATGRILVEDVDLIEPAGDVNADPITAATPEAAYRAPFCTGVEVEVRVVND